KRRYEAHFVNKLTDCDGENSETDTALDFARDCGYISPDQHLDFIKRCSQVGRMIGGVLKNPESFIL
ncbi:MAG: four helix bundle protein, partial [Bacteroidota bacterium]